LLRRLKRRLLTIPLVEPYVHYTLNSDTYDGRSGIAYLVAKLILPYILGKNPKIAYFRRYNYQRAKCEGPKIIKKWFDLVQITMMQHGIAYEDVYNFDETGYAHPTTSPITGPAIHALEQAQQETVAKLISNACQNF